MHKQITKNVYYDIWMLKTEFYSNYLLATKIL